MKINLLLERSKYSKTQLQALALLEENDEFIIEITQLRQQFNVPATGFSVQFSPGGQILNGKETARVLNQSMSWIDQAVKDLIWLFDLPVSWYGALVGIVLFQFSPPLPDINPISIEYTGVFSIDDLLRKTKKQTEYTPQPTNSLLIRISEKMSFKKLTSELTKNKQLIDRYLDDLPSTPNFSRTKDLEVKKEMLSLTRSGKTDREIADIFHEKYPNKNTFHDETTISVYRNRFKAHLAKLPRRIQLRQLMKAMSLPNT